MQWNQDGCPSSEERSDKRAEVDNRHSEDQDSAETREGVLGAVEKGKKRTKSNLEEGQRDSSDARRFVSDKFEWDPATSQQQRAIVTTRRELTNLEREMIRTKETKTRKTMQRTEKEQPVKFLKTLNVSETKKVQEEIVEVAQMEKNEEMNVEWRTEEKITQVEKATHSCDLAHVCQD